MSMREVVFNEPGRMSDSRLYIDGQWRESQPKAWIDVFDPATGELAGRCARASRFDVEAALVAAVKGLDTWRRVDLDERADVLQRIAANIKARSEDIAREMTVQQGKPIAQSRGEIAFSAEQFSWHAREAPRLLGTQTAGKPGHESRVAYEPVGVVAAFTPWNAPAALSARKLAAALATGCSIVIKPAEQVPAPCMRLVEACEAAGVPAGVVNLLTGDPAEISSMLLASPNVRKVAFTGSTEIGRSLLREGVHDLKRMTLELGGHAPVIVMPDVDVEKVTAELVSSKFKNAGQICVAPSRFYVHRAIAPAFLSAFVRRASALKIGHGLEPATELGPLVSARRREAVDSLVRRTVAAGAKLECGGRAPPGIDRGFFYEPTVLSSVPDEAPVLREEPFGPIAPIMVFDDVNDAIARANATPYGLGAYLFSRDAAAAADIAGRLEAGMVGVNCTNLSLADSPFGGVKHSGFGREGGFLGLLEYVSPKFVNHVL